MLIEVIVCFLITNIACRLCRNYFAEDGNEYSTLYLVFQALSLIPYFNIIPTVIISLFALVCVLDKYKNTLANVLFGRPKSKKENL